MNINFNNRQQVLIIGAVSAVGLWITNSLILTPLVGSWETRSSNITALQKQVHDGEQLLLREGGIRGRWSNMRTNTLPTEVSVAEGRLLGAFDGWSRESRVSIMSIKPQWKRSDDDFMTLECRVDASGNLATITRFLYEIEHNPLALKVESVELNSRDTTGAQMTLGLQVSGLVLGAETR